MGARKVAGVEPIKASHATGLVQGNKLLGQGAWPWKTKAEDGKDPASSTRKEVRRPEVPWDPTGAAFLPLPGIPCHLCVSNVLVLQGFAQTLLEHFRGEISLPLELSPLGLSLFAQTACFSHENVIS